MKQSDFKQCHQSGFCSRNRAFSKWVRNSRKSSSELPVPPRFYLNEKSFKLEKKKVFRAQVIPSSHPVQELNVEKPLNMELSYLSNGAIRCIIDETIKDQNARWRVENVIIGSDQEALLNIELENVMDSGVKYAKLKALDTSLDVETRIYLDPFKIEVIVDGKKAAIVNGRGYFNFEQFRNQPDLTPETSEEVSTERKDQDIESEEMDQDIESETKSDESTKESNEPSEWDQIKGQLTFGLWEEKFGDHTDPKKFGPRSFGVDIEFPNSNSVYGIPEHASKLALKSTKNDDGVEGKDCFSEPYRLYNLDVFEYEINSPVALYGSVPFMWSHGLVGKDSSQSTGLFWLNAAETWVDVETHLPKDKDGFVLQWNPFSSNDNTESRSVETHWISESGVMEFYILPGKEPKDVFKQYSGLTGSQNLPPLFSLGYHQCRWNYVDQKDVQEVHQGFEDNDIPMDVLWLDIEHTDDKRYFTWHETKFNDPVAMQNEFAKVGRKMVTIVDPHIKRDDKYSVKAQASRESLFVRNKDGGEYDGWCWPGSSSWIDFLNPHARCFWMKQFEHDQYKGSTEHLFTWNDMNEPSVFSGPEITMPKSNLHWKDIEHRDVHNIYGMMLHRATYSGHVYRSLPNGKFEVSADSWLNRTNLMDGPNPHRPFVLSRAFFAGTQRYGAIWTGDNIANWEHLSATPAMLLSISLSGVGFCGADVGGFFGNPDAELMTRWYQAGVYYPFFRGHAHIDTKRREPWIYGAPYTGYIRDAIRLRYRLLPYWYTLFRQNQLTGETPIRPLFVEFPLDEKVFDTDDTYMVGPALLVKPVANSLSAGGDSQNIYLPGQETWFNLFSHISYSSQRVHNLKTPISSPIPALLRSGYGIVTRERIRRSSHLTLHDPISVIFALDSAGKSQAQWYIDDGESFSYVTKGEFSHKKAQVESLANSLVIKAREIDAREFTADGKMEEWQKPFLSDKIIDENGHWRGFDAVEDTMNINSNVEYRDRLNEIIGIERITILETSSSGFGTLSRLLKNLSNAKIEITTNSNARELKADDFITLETIKESNIYGKETTMDTNGVLESHRLVIRKPPVGSAADWTINISF